MSTVDDLRRVIRRIEGARPPRPAAEPVERVVDGELHDTGQGTIVLVQREYPLSHRHGTEPLADAVAAPLAVLARAARVEGDVAAAGGLLFLDTETTGLAGGTGTYGFERVDTRYGPAWRLVEVLPVGRLVGVAPAAPHAYLDTETTGLAGGTGTYAFLVGAALVEGDRLVVRQYFMRDFDDEPALLTALEPLLARAAAIVTFNGAGFDLPLLETRFILARRRWPASLAHLDLLRPARRVWTGWLPDCRLSTLESAVLGLAREDDVPGGLIPLLYFDYLRTRRAGPLRRIFEHNRSDVLSLVALVGWFGRALLDGSSVRPEELAGLGRLWEPFDLERSLACYRGALGAGLPEPVAQWARLRLAWWEKRAARWTAACGDVCPPCAAPSERRSTDSGGTTPSTVRCRRPRPAAMRAASPIAVPSPGVSAESACCTSAWFLVGGTAT